MIGIAGLTPREGQREEGWESIQSSVPAKESSSQQLRPWNTEGAGSWRSVRCLLWLPQCMKICIWHRAGALLQFVLLFRV